MNLLSLHFTMKELDWCRVKWRSSDVHSDKYHNSICVSSLTVV